MKKIVVCLMLIVVTMLVGCTTGEIDDGKYEVQFVGFDDKVLFTMTVEDGEKINYPDAPEVEGYGFVKWMPYISYTDEDVVIKAKYSELVYEVNFYDYNNNIIKTQNVKYNENANAPTEKLEKVGYTFVGWDTNFNNVKSNLEVRPLYNINSFTVTFYDAYGNILDTQQVEYGKSAILPTNPTKEEYVFVKWDQDTTSVTANLEVRPVFTQTFYTVKFYDGEDCVVSEQKVAAGGSAILPVNPTKDGYTFTSWDQDTTNITSNLDVRPLFEKNKYTVKFYDGSGNVISEQQVEHGENATAPTAPTKLGSNFIKWDQSYTNVTSNLDVLPVFEDIYYEVTFIGLYGVELDSQMVKAYTAAEAPIPPTIDYYTFSKWDKDFSQITQNITINAIYTKNNTTYAMSNVNYWLQILSHKYDITKTILTPEEIDAYNAQIFSDYSKTKVVDLNTISKTTTSTNVTALINNYSNINKYTVYNDSTKTAVSTTVKNTIVSNRNLNSMSSNIAVKFGIIVDFAWVRSYPTNYYSNSYSMDRFQETSLNVGEGVAIYHESTDGQWYFVQAQNYNGWVEKKYIAECTYDIMINFLNPTERLLVVSDYVTLESAYVRMGQSFPLVGVDSSNYIISFPTRNSDGSLNLKSLSVPISNDYHIGYLDYTYQNLFVQAFKLLGIDYSWGDKNKDGRDCSSTMNAFYSCFGFKMPRNTSNQVKIPTYSEATSGITSTYIKNYKPGTLVYTSSHVMMYIGEDASGVSYLFHNTTSGNGECILQTFNGYGGTNMIGLLKMQ